MADVFSKAKRSEIMGRVRGKGNEATEQRLARLLREHHIRGWRRNYSIYGKPDFVFPKRRVAVFVDGEFWHGHPTRAKLPSTNREFWRRKIDKNKKRDAQVNVVLAQKRWTVVRIWQHELKTTAWLHKLAQAGLADDKA